jgi:hypothetical protein
MRCLTSGIRNAAVFRLVYLIFCRDGRLDVLDRPRSRHLVDISGK